MTLSSAPRDRRRGKEKIAFDVLYPPRAPRRAAGRLAPFTGAIAAIVFLQVWQPSSRSSRSALPRSSPPCRSAWAPRTRGVATLVFAASLFTLHALRTPR
jgi:hypothetical protein